GGRYSRSSPVERPTPPRTPVRTTATTPHSSTGPKTRFRRDRQSSAGTVSAAAVRSQPVARATGPAPPPDRTTTTPTTRSETAAATAGTHHHTSRPPK